MKAYRRSVYEMLDLVSEMAEEALDEGFDGNEYELIRGIVSQLEDEAKN